MKEIGTLTPVDVRELWPDEARDFTPWLAEQQDLLGQALALDQLAFVEKEAPVGVYKADLLFRDEQSGTLVVVENMLGETDHDHIGKLLTYMAGLEAGYAVLVATKFRAEHRSALSYLNTRSDGIGFFGVVLEAWRIGDSIPAPRLRVEVHPDDWQRTVKASQKELSDREALYTRFWTGVLDAIRTKYPCWTRAKGSKYQWISLPSSRSAIAKYNPSFCRPDGQYRLRAEVYVDTGESDSTKRAFDHLHRQKDEIHKELNETLEWDRIDEKRASRISLYFPGEVQVTEEERWEDAQKWLLDAVGELRRVFDPLISEFDGTN